jgi:hypothetical protein
MMKASLARQVAWDSHHADPIRGGGGDYVTWNGKFCDDTEHDRQSISTRTAPEIKLRYNHMMGSLVRQVTHRTHIPILHSTQKTSWNYAVCKGNTQNSKSWLERSHGAKNSKLHCMKGTTLNIRATVWDSGWGRWKVARQGSTWVCICNHLFTRKYLWTTEVNIHCNKSLATFSSPAGMSPNSPWAGII